MSYLTILVKDIPIPSCPSLTSSSPDTGKWDTDDEDEDVYLFKKSVDVGSFAKMQRIQVRKQIEWTKHVSVEGAKVVDPVEDIGHGDTIGSVCVILKLIIIDTEDHGLQLHRLDVNVGLSVHDVVGKLTDEELMAILDGEKVYP